MEKPLTEIAVGFDLAGTINEYRHRRFDLDQALLELIDNSIDAGAANINISEVDDDLVVDDDGEGFPDLASALVAGRSAKRNGDKIGRYGVGLKHACIRWSKSTTIESRGHAVTVSWDEIISGDSDGTTFLVPRADDGHTRVILEGFSYTRVIDTSPLRKTYTPILEGESVSMTVNGKKLTPLDRPEFTQFLDETVEWQGKKVRVEGGIFDPADPQRKSWSGYNLFYAGRLIGKGKIVNAGVGDEGCTNFSFNVHLLDGEEKWVLATNKDDVDSRDLLDYIYNLLTRPLLHSGADIAREIELRSVEESVNQQLSASGNIRRKNTAGKSGTVKPKNTGKRKRRTRTDDDDGDYTPYRDDRIRAGGKVLFKFQHLGGETLGEVQDQGRQIIVIANLDNEFIREHKTNETLILAVAKLCYAMRKKATHDTVPSSFVSSVMDLAGTELGA